MAYESMEKKKAPYYCYIIPNGKSGYGRLSLAYNGKEVDNLDVKFLSSLNDDGVGEILLMERCIDEDNCKYAYLEVPYA